MADLELKLELQQEPIKNRVEQFIKKMVSMNFMYTSNPDAGTKNTIMETAKFLKIDYEGTVDMARRAHEGYSEALKEFNDNCNQVINACSPSDIRVQDSGAGGIQQLPKIFVRGWIAPENIITYKENEYIGGMGGWFSGHSYQDYLANFAPEAAPYIEALAKEIIEKNLRITGEHHQHGGGIPLFNDGTFALFSFRAWGDLMAAIYTKKTGKQYSYLDFYYTCFDVEEGA